MRADRLLSLLMLLQVRGSATARELAERLEVSERTIYRDIEALSSAGVPVYAERGPGGGCVLAEGYRTNLTGLTEAEVRALFLPGMERPLAELGAGKAIEAGLLKLLAALPSAQQRHVEHTRQRLYMDTVGWFYSGVPLPFLHIIREAIWNDRKLQLTYRKSNGEVSERVIEPLGLVVKAGLWYVVAISHGDMRVFRVSRVLNAVILDEPCQRPTDFDLEKYWQEWSVAFTQSWSSYSATIRISPAFVATFSQAMGETVAHRIEQAPPPDEEGWVTITLEFDSFEIARSNILGFGTMVEVVEPEDFRQSVIQIASAIVEFYKEKAP